MPLPENRNQPSRTRSFEASYAYLTPLPLFFPMLLAVNVPPSATYFNQALAFFGWGVWAILVPASPSFGVSRRPFRALVVVLALLACATGLAPILSGSPWALTVSSGAGIGAAAIAIALGATPSDTRSAANLFRLFCLGLLFAGLASSAIGLVQVGTPDLADGNWIARTSVEGRAVGNLRQPNHLCSLLLWAIVAAAWLGEARVIRFVVSWTLAAVLLFAVVLSGSRSGVIGVVLLAAWGVLDNGNSRRTRVGLLLCPVAYGLFWTATSTWAGTADHAIGTAGRFTTNGDISSSRFGIWSNTLDLIRMHPWTGVGFGEFNFAWTLTEFSNRPTAFFDHTHNLALQFAVELGLPLAALVLGLLGWALWRAWRNCLQPTEPQGTASPQRAAVTMLVLILVHSMLEYPLWYAYFLLPTAFLFGLCLAKPGGAVSAEAAAPRARGKPYLVRIGAAAMMLGALYSMVDYMRVAAIFAPPANAAPLEERIALGQRSLLFSHHADYAAATTSVDPSIALPAARRAAHYLLDTRLMMAWANALHASGDTERAKYLAQRLVEFRNSVSEPYFAPCKDPSLTDAQRPYQCFAPQRKFAFEDFR